MPSTATAVPGRLNYFNDEDYVRPDPARGTLRDAGGRRLVRASADLIAALPAALIREGAAPDEVMYRLGRRWGDADFRAFAERAPREFGVSGLEQMHFHVMLECWRWPLSAAGWGSWKYDFRRARVGLPVVDLQHSVMCEVNSSNPAETAAAHQAPTKPACYLYAGLFAAVFTALAKRELAGVELQCAAMGADGCRIMVASAAKAASAAKLRDEGIPAEEILDRLAAPPASPESKGDHGP